MRRLLMIVLAVLALASFAAAACGQASSPIEEPSPPKGQNSDPSDVTGTVKGEVGETLDLGESTIVVREAKLLGPDPKVSNLKYEGTFVAVSIDYTYDGKDPVTIPTQLLLELSDSEGRTYLTGPETGIKELWAAEQGRSYPGEHAGGTLNPGVTWNGADAFQVAPGSSGFVLHGSDFACPQCGRGFEVDLGL